MSPEGERQYLGEDGYWYVATPIVVPSKTPIANAAAPRVVPSKTPIADDETASGFRRFIQVISGLLLGFLGIKRYHSPEEMEALKQPKQAKPPKLPQKL